MTTIKDAPIVEQLMGTEKIPVSNGSGKPAAVTVNQILGKSGIKIIESEEELENLDLPIGSVVIVGSESSVVEIFIKDCKQVTSEDIDQNTSQILNIDSFNTVESIQFEFPEWPQGDIQGGMFTLINKDFNTHPIMMQILVEEGVIGAIYTDQINQDEQHEMRICEYSDPINYEINQENLDQFNQLFNEYEWVYLGYPDFSTFPDTETLNQMLDFVNVFVKFRSGYPTKSDIYIKGDTWEKVDYKKYEKAFNIASELQKKTNYPVMIQEADMDGNIMLKPNTYNVCVCTDTRIDFGFTVDLDAQNLSHIYEYVIELQYNGDVPIHLPDSVKWLNEDTPSFTVGKKYLISIVGNLGVWGEF